MTDVNRDSLQENINRITTGIKKREQAKVYQFPIWADPQRGIPNAIARSALFCARNTMGNEYLDGVSICSQRDLSITYSGPRLTQHHLDVFEAIMHLARETPERQYVEFSRYELLNMIGRTQGGADYKRLLRTFDNLTSTSVKIKTKNGKLYWGSLLPRGVSDENSEFFRVEINRDLIKFFEAGFTLMQQEQRKQLARSPLAKHLQCWLSSHNRPYSVKVEYLQELTGSNVKSLHRFKQALKTALGRLVEVGVLDDWSIDKKNLVTFVKPKN